VHFNKNKKQSWKKKPLKGVLAKKIGHVRLAKQEKKNASMWRLAWLGLHASSFFFFLHKDG